MPTSLVDAVDSIIVGFDGIDSLAAALSIVVILARFSGSSPEILVTGALFSTVLFRV